MKRIILTILLAMLLVPLGMQAQSKAKKKVKKEQKVPQLMNYPSAEVGKDLLHGGNVVIKGRLIAQDPKMIEQMSGRFKVIMRDYIVRKEKTSLIEFKPDGTFSLNVYVPYPMMVLVYPLAEVYACPGDTVDMTIDTTKPTLQEGVIIGGTGVSSEVSKLTYKIRMAYFPPQQVEISSEQGADALMKWKDEQVAKLDTLVMKMNNGLPELKDCSPMASDILRTYIIRQRLYSIFHQYYLFVDGNKSIDREAFWQQYFSFVTPREKYLLDNPLLMIAGDEFFFNRMESTLMRPFNDFGMSIDNIRKRIHSEVAEKLHLSPTNFSLQVCTLREAFNMLKWWKDDYEYAADDVANTMQYITHPELIRRAVLTYRDYVKENELQVIEQKPMTKGDSIFQRIIEPYKGNVLYVDFWAMSCSPCRAEMLRMRNEVEANKNKPVKYLYVTSDSPDLCRPFLEPNNIKGEHIYITASEWGYLQEKFQFSAIPFVALFDKQGKQRKDVTVEQLLEE
ncbi:MAG: redoxin domain-containing protein [Prevotella sp.]|nr:redoxin domain-containing protein [Prevotella sp.]